MNLLRSIRPFAESLLLIGAVVSAGVFFQKYRDAKSEYSGLNERYVHQVRLNDSTVAQLAQARLEKKQYAGLLDAADSVHGKLIAAAKIRVAARDTIIVHDTIPTTLLPDSTRVATFHDSTFAGTITGTVTAPPCCQPLRLDSLRIHRPPFSPSVGFVQTGSRTVAVVVWQGERAEIETTPFVDTTYVHVPPKRFTVYAEGLVDPATTLTAAGGADLRAFWGLSVTARVEQQLKLGEPLQLKAGIRKTW